MIEDKIIR